MKSRTPYSPPPLPTRLYNVYNYNQKMSESQTKAGNLDLLTNAN